MLIQWPSFRGPAAKCGPFTTAPVNWDLQAGEGIRWNVEAPQGGFNSPWLGFRLFLSRATKELREVYCYDTETGQLLWRQALPAFAGTPETPPKVSEDTGYAAPTMAVHGDRAFAIYATADIACFDFEGRLLWGRNLGVPENHYGHASSLIAFGDKVYVQLDDSKQPRLLALDAATGEDVWSAGRKKISWASPACAPTPFGFQLLLASELDVDGYEPETGTLLWTQEAGQQGGAFPRYRRRGVCGQRYAMATAVRLSARPKRYNPDHLAVGGACGSGQSTSSDDYFYIATSLGEIICLDKNTGEEVWLHEFDQGFYSSRSGGRPHLRRGSAGDDADPERARNLR